MLPALLLSTFFSIRALICQHDQNLVHRQARATYITETTAARLWGYRDPAPNVPAVREDHTWGLLLAVWNGLFRDKVQMWTTELKTLSDIARSKPHMAYAALRHGMIVRWVYLAWANPDRDLSFQPLKDGLLNDFIPAVTGIPAVGTTERELLALPVKVWAKLCQHSRQMTSLDSASKKWHSIWWT